MTEFKTESHSKNTRAFELVKEISKRPKVVIAATLASMLAIIEDSNPSFSSTEVLDHTENIFQAYYN